MNKPFEVMRYLAFLLALPLMAQLNPKWQTINSPDFLNLYQQSNSTTIKPEIVTVFDFSGSMARGSYHPSFSNMDTGDGDSGSDIQFTLTRGGSSPSYTYSCSASMSVASGRYPYGTGTSYTAFNLTSGTLIRPDGTVVTQALIDANYVASAPALPGETASPFSSDLRNWIRSASHVRFTYNGRTLDLPISWTILDDFSVQRDVANGQYRHMYNTYPLKMTILDPVSNTEVEMDTRYRVSGSTIPIGTPTSSGWPRTLSYKCSFGNFWARSYMHWMWRSTPQPIPNATATANYGYQNTIPGRSRSQAVKDAALRVWVKYYKRVFWAYRFLHNSGSNLEGGRGNYLSNDTHNTFPGDPTTTPTAGGGQRGWMLMNGNSLAAMRKLAAYTDVNGTPLNMALGNALAQFNDPNSVFNTVEVAPDDSPQECMKHFVILFTDGQPNGEGTGRETSVASPYISAGAGDVLAGNTILSANRSLMNPSNTSGYFNIINLAAVAAHGADSGQLSFLTVPAYPAAGTYTGGSATVDNWIPFWIKERAGTSFTTPHAIQTMTVGVSLAGDYTSTSSSKYRMFAAAALGDPTLKTWNLTSTGLKPFALTDPGNTSSPKDPDSVYFFDAADPSLLVNYLDKAFEASTAIANTNSTSTPVLPTIGSGLGNSVYIGKFAPPATGGPVWPGDLLMYPIREDSTGVSRMLDSDGLALTGSDLADPDKAQWAASTVIQTLGWANRTIYTRQSASSGTAQPPMLKVTVTVSNTAATIADPGYNAIKASLPGSSDSDKFDNWRYFIGADVGSAAAIKPTRSTVMGDVVNSTPAVLDYTTLPSTVTSSVLTTAWTAHGSDNPSFSVVFVGTNQGLFHAFGEVSWDKLDLSGKKLRTGVADELWAFAPTDLVPYVDYFRNSGNAHRFGVDGSPTVYLLDLPALGGSVGNGKFDVNSTSERAIVIFGLGKGGRSYYAIDVRDPAAPMFQETHLTYGEGMGWALCPDETYNYPSTRFVLPASSASAPVLTRMGLSTSIPSLARVVATSSKLIKDVVLLGGGFSLPEIEANLPSSPAPTTGTHLGRSVVAVETKRGNILGVWDLTSVTSAGPVSAGVAPHTFFKGTGLTQRAYFNDYHGGLWALGYGGLDSNNIRMDSSWLDQWASSPRPVYKQSPTEGLLSTMPVVFDVPSMPTRTTSPILSPAAVGIALATGDRNNPMDLFYTSTWVKPTRHRVNVIFDRQDSYLLGLDSTGMATANLQDTTGLDASSDELNPSLSAFYLKSKYGYFINFPAPSAGFVPKGIIVPAVPCGASFLQLLHPNWY